MIRRNRVCEECGERLSLVERFDAYACFACNAWREKSCGDSECGYCSERPEVPLEWLRPIGAGGLPAESRPHKGR